MGVISWRLPVSWFSRKVNRFWGHGHGRCLERVGDGCLLLSVRPPQGHLGLFVRVSCQGKGRLDSDIDLAVYFGSPYQEQDVTTVWSRVEEIARRDVDLIVLNTALPGIAWSSMKGRVLVDKNPRLELMLERSSEAEDFREFATAILKERMRRWRDENAHPVT